VSPRTRSSYVDALFLALGAVGLVLALVLLPRYHPDAVATYEVGAQGAAEASRDFLEASGYSVEGFTPRVHLARDARLLDTMQVRLGRRTAIAALTGGAREILPTHYWRVRWQPHGDETDVENGPLVRLTMAGRVWSLTTPDDYAPARDADDAVLRQALGPAAADTMVATRLAFDVRETVAADALPAERVWQMPAGTQPAALDARQAARLAEVHLGRTSLAALPLEVYSVAPAAGAGRNAVRVRFVTTGPVLEQTAEIDVDVTAAGRLLVVSTSFNGTATGPLVTTGITVGTGGAGPVREVLRWGGYLLLLLVLLAIVLRRMAARALDARAALRDALVGAVAAGTAMMLVAPMLNIDGDGETWTVFLMVFLVGFFNAVFIGLIVFIASAGGDALARARWPETVANLSLARQGTWVNVPVGRAVLRGAGLGLALVGMNALALAVLADAPLHLAGRPSFLGAEISYSPFAASIASSTWYALLVGLGVGQGLGSLLRGWHRAAVVPGLALAFAALAAFPIAFPTGTPLLTVAVLLLVGTLLALAVHRIGVLAFIVGFVVAGVVGGVAEGWIVPGSPAWIDVALAGLFVAGLLGLGWAGVRSGRTGDSLPAYEPDFIVEQRERARLQREFEIAREVQRSFLPNRVPEVEGVELAARCVPAEEVGGDYYDLIPLGPHRLGVVIGDVSGKGIQAAFFMTLVKGFVQALAPEMERPTEVLSRMNGLFSATMPRGTFISMIYGVLDLRACTFTFARAGHTPLLVRRAGQPAEARRPNGLAVGMTRGPIFDETLREECIELCPGDTFVLYTDGLSEAMDRRRRLYSDERLVATISSAPDGADALLDAVLADVRAHAGRAGVHDDLTMVVLRVAPPSPVPDRFISIAEDAFT
jgi:phosphoserine phosphatase RsbU/P